MVKVSDNAETGHNCNNHRTLPTLFTHTHTHTHTHTLHGGE
jgi:hypothetical protein